MTTTSIKAQLKEVSLESKIKNSTLIVEGKVDETRSFLASNGEIYTANLIEIQRILKETDFPTDYVTIITLGGEVNGRRASWSNLISLQKGEKGVFFLTPTKRPDESGFSSPKFEVYSSKQGFLKYHQVNGKSIAFDPFNRYDAIEEEIFQKIRTSTGENFRDIRQDKFQEEDCIIYTIEPVIETNLTPFQIAADIKVSTSGGAYPLYQSTVVIKYDESFFGSYIVAEGNLLAVDGDLSELSEYDLSLTDLSSNTVEIRLSANDMSNLFHLTSEKSYLARLYLTVEDPLGIPYVYFDTEAMEEGNFYYDAEADKVKKFNCFEIKNEVFPEICPDIISFDPDTLSAGSQSIINIRGTNFGAPTATLPPPGSAVLFTKTRQAGTVGQWMYPFEGDYVSWSDTLIRVKVPSIGYDLTTGSPVNNIAGTGKIAVIRDGCIDSTARELYLKFSAMNEAIVSSTGAVNVIPRKLVNRNGEGGYDLYYTPAFQALNSGDAIPAFERALSTWRCADGVNFRTKDYGDIPAAYQSNACKIDYGILPEGVSAAAVAYTNVDSIDYCGTSVDNIWHAFLEKFSLVFSSSIKWHTGTDTMAINWIDTLDLETIALHELGHAHQLFHVNNPPNVLYYLSTAYRRALHEDDLCGGKHIVQISAVDTIQFCQPAMKIVPPEECDITRVISLHKEGAEVYAFPNPASDVLFLGIKEREYSSQYSFSLYNGIGQVLLRGELNDGDTPTEIFLDGLPRGFLHVVLSKNRIPIATVKLIKF